MSVEKTTVDGVVQLFLNGELKLEQENVEFVTIGSRVEYDDKWNEIHLPAEYDKALVGNNATLANTTVSVDGMVAVDETGLFFGLQVNGGTISGSGICRDAVGWYGAGLCLTAMTADGGYFTPGVTPPEDARGLISLRDAFFSACSVSPMNGYTGHGGAIETYGGTLSLVNTDFDRNSATGSGAAGGALALMYSENTITGGTFSGNTAYFGGAIQQNGGTMTVTGALFSGNSTSGEATETYPTGNAGGAIELHQGAKATIDECDFTENSAFRGGAIYTDTFNKAVSTADIYGGTFTGNTAEAEGGAIYNDGVMTVVGAVFKSNSVIASDSETVQRGGAVANTKNGSLTVTGGTFGSNNAVQGGAIATFIDYGSSDTANLTVSGAEFNDNAATYGGGIYIQTGMADSTTVSDTDFSGNAASYGGGAVCQCFGQLSVTGGTFSENSAGNDGGAIAAWDSGNTASGISGATFDSNTALYGGAISHTWASAALTVNGCVFTANGGETTEQGGAIWNDANSTGVVTVSGCTFGGNTAKAGGAVWNAGNMKLENIVLATATDTVYNSGSLAFAGVNTLNAAVVNDGRITIAGSSFTASDVTNSGTITIDGSLTASSISGDGTIRIAVELADPVAVTADVSGGIIDLVVTLADLTESSYQFIGGTIGEGVTFQVNGVVYEEDVFIDGTNYILTTNGGTGLWIVQEASHETEFFTGSFDSSQNMIGKITDSERAGLKSDIKFYAGDGTAWGALWGIEDGWTYAGVGDFNGDGKDDILRYSAEGYVVTDNSNGDGTFTPAVLNYKNVGWDILGTGDFNGDGVDDVLVANPTAASATVGLLGYWSKGTDWTLINGYSDEWTLVGTGDYDGNGCCDMLWKNTFEGEGGGTYNAYCTWRLGDLADGIDWSIVMVAKVNETETPDSDAWSYLGTGDFNGDGVADIAMINDMGVVAIDTLAAGSGASAWWTVLSAVPEGWEMIGATDLNLDGTDDIAWATRNEVGYLAGYWQVNANDAGQPEMTAWHNMGYLA
ncbi:MAG: hypothetical protein IJT68_03700 [Lentisphaeria bacterium]|nr:hypothetical protein [Lentisphaeria bacterium]